MSFESELDQVLFEAEPAVSGVSAPGIETDVYKAEPVGAAAKNKIKLTDGQWKKMPKGDTRETQMIKTIIQALDERFEELFGKFAELGAK